MVWHVHDFRDHACTYLNMHLPYNICTCDVIHRAWLQTLRAQASWTSIRKLFQLLGTLCTSVKSWLPHVTAKAIVVVVVLVLPITKYIEVLYL